MLKDPSDLLNSIENMAKGAYEVEVESKKKRDGTQVLVSFDLPYLKKHIRESIEMNDMGQLTEGSIRWNKVSMFSPEADYKKAEAALGENLAFMLQSIFERFSTMKTARGYLRKLLIRCLRPSLLCLATAGGRSMLAQSVEVSRRAYLYPSIKCASCLRRQRLLS